MDVIFKKGVLENLKNEGPVNHSKTTSKMYAENIEKIKILDQFYRYGSIYSKRGQNREKKLSQKMSVKTALILKKVSDDKKMKTYASCATTQNGRFFRIFGRAFFVFFSCFFDRFRTYF